MPLTSKGRKIMSAMKEQYGAKKGERVFYASRNAGKIKGVDPESRAEGGPVKPQSLYNVATAPPDPTTGAAALGEQNPTIHAMMRAHQERQRAIQGRAAGGPVGVAGLQVEQFPGQHRHRAAGGPASHTPYIVGEKGPEMFVPDSPGTIIPHHELRRLARKYGGRVGR